MKIIWVGNKYSDIKNCNNFFSHSINLYGPNNQNTFSFPYTRLSNSLNITNADRFINYKAHRILLEYPDAVFMFYNPTRAFSMDFEIKQRTICINNQSLLNMLNNKSICHNLFSNILNFAPYVNLFGKEISLESLRTVFNNDTFIIQEPNSAGGLGTHILSLKHKIDIQNLIQPDSLYLISSYIYPNISFNVHLLIMKDNFIAFPPSLQILSISDNGTFVFRGSDFINVNTINKVKLNKILTTIANRLNQYNYLGIIGIDFIQDVNGEIYFVEFNCRFQASSFLLNMSLKDCNLPSLQELNYQAFTNKSLKLEKNLAVPYASVIYYDSSNDEIIVPNSELYLKEEDCLSDYKKFEKFSYLFKNIFKSKTKR